MPEALAYRDYGEWYALCPQCWKEQQLAQTPGATRVLNCVHCCTVSQVIWPQDEEQITGLPVALAYINHGRWIVDCPVCPSAEELPRKTENQDSLVQCQGCHQIIRISWPKNSQQLMRVLKERPIANRHWYPTGYPFAMKHGIPHGQTVAELHEETLQHMQVDLHSVR